MAESDRPTAEQLAEWQRLADAATPRLDDFFIDAETVVIRVTTASMGDGTLMLRTNDWRFLAAARTAMPVLLAEVARLRAELTVIRRWRWSTPGGELAGNRGRMAKS